MFELSGDLLCKISNRIDELSANGVDVKREGSLHFNNLGCDSCSSYCDPGCGALCEFSGSD